ncbi:MAG: hypothetical protein SCJ94_08590 [Bacillota bacterium]|nr:hypothetical protein [Bacillota bacterium]
MLEYLPALIILCGLGAMAYFMTKSGKDADQKRKAAAEERKWQYENDLSPVVVSTPDDERNISYRLAGKTEQGVNWKVTCRHLKKIDKGGNLKVELLPSTEFEADKTCGYSFLIMAHEGITLPDFVLTEIFKKLNFPVDTPRLAASLLPDQLSGHYAVYSAASEAVDLAANAALHLTTWRNKYPGKENALVFVSDLQGIKVRTERGMEKAEEMISFTEIALNLSQVC